MAKRNLQQINFKENFLYGIDYDDSPFDMLGSPDCINVFPDPVGSIKTRKGFSKHNSVAIAGSTGISGLAAWYLQGATPTELFNALGGGKWYRDSGGTWNDITGSLSLTSNQDNLISTAILNNRLVVGTRLRDQLFQDTGSGNASVVTGSPPAAEGVVSFFRRIFAWGVATNPLLLYYSAADNTNSWSTGTDFLNFDEGMGVRVSGAYAQGNDRLLVFKDGTAGGSIHMVVPTGSTPPFTKYLLFDNIGCVSNQSIVPLPDGSVMFGDRNDFYIIRGTSVESATRHPRTGKPRLNRWFKDLISSSRQQYWVSTYIPRLNVYRLLYSGVGSTKNNLCLDYHVPTKSWWPHDIEGQCIVIRLVSGDPRPYIGRTDGYAMRNDFGENDDGSAVSWRYSTPWRAGRNQNVRKKGDSVYASVEKNGNYSVTSDVFIDFGQNAEVSQTLTTNNLSGALWDVAQWNVNNWPSENTSLEGYAPINRLYKAIRVLLRANGLNNPTKIHEFSIYERPLEITARTN